jgi:hypothetical protein
MQCTKCNNLKHMEYFYLPLFPSGAQVGIACSQLLRSPEKTLRACMHHKVDRRGFTHKLLPQHAVGALATSESRPIGQYRPKSQLFIPTIRTLCRCEMVFAAIGCPQGRTRGIPLISGRVIPILSYIDDERRLHVESVYSHLAQWLVVISPYSRCAVFVIYVVALASELLLEF